jgi:hypothetical protein
MRSSVLACPWSLSSGVRHEAVGKDRGEFGYMGHYEELVELCDTIGKGGQPSLTVRQARAVLAVEKAIIESCVTRQAIDFAAFGSEHGLDA